MVKKVALGLGAVLLLSIIGGAIYYFNLTAPVEVSDKPPVAPTLTIPTVATTASSTIAAPTVAAILTTAVPTSPAATADKKILDNKNFQITKDRGKWYPGPNDTEVIVIYHPSYVLRMMGLALIEVQKTVIEDLRMAKERLEALRAGTAQPQPWQKPKAPDENGQLSMF